jgi:hypothetical protein
MSFEEKKTLTKINDAKKKVNELLGVKERILKDE